jgi:hypothetical protein
MTRWTLVKNERGKGLDIWTYYREKGVICIYFLAYTSNTLVHVVGVGHVQYLVPMPQSHPGALINDIFFGHVFPFSLL